MRFNIFSKKSRAPECAKRTHEGAPALALTPAAQLERTLMACMLWEDSFYESGVSVAERIRDLTQRVDAEWAGRLAIKAREEGNLRHAPLLLMRELARHPERPRLADALARVIKRADEPAEFLALYWAEGKQPLTRQVKLGLAKAFRKFDAYELAKYNRDGQVKLRDVLFMIHAKPESDAQAALWKALAENRLTPPDTWEVALSGGADKRETFTRLLREKKLGYMALLRNLRNMHAAGVDEGLMREALLRGAGVSKVLPFRFVAAARTVPALEPVLDEAMQRSLPGLEKMSGKTAVLVDVSGSMDYALSRKSDLSRIDAAAALAVLIGGITEGARIFTFSEKVVEVPPRKGMALMDAVKNSQAHQGTYLGKALREVQARGKYDRVIVITDEQSADPIPAPRERGYMINVASYQNGVGYDDWTRINGFSESVVRYIQALEKTG